MTADEMFEELGYEKKKTNSNFIVYLDILDIKEIIFYLKPIKFQVLMKKEPAWVDLKELQAINEKVKELGWNEQNNTNEDKQCTKSRITSSKTK